MDKCPICGDPKDSPQHYDDGFNVYCWKGGKMAKERLKVVELDQWSAHADNLRRFSLADFESGEAFAKLDGSAAVVKKIFGGHFKILEVDPAEGPKIATVWLKNGPDGKLEIWKANYDSSD